MVTSHGVAITDRAPRYLTQLVRHMTHRGMKVDTDDATWASTDFGFGTCTLSAQARRLVVTVTTADPTTHARAQQALTRDIERFGRRDGLTVTWQAVDDRPDPEQPARTGRAESASMHLPADAVEWRTIAPGVQRGDLRPTKPGAGTALLHFAGGSTSGHHRHPGGEELFVVFGRIRIDDVVLGAGDHLYTPPGGVNDAAAYEDSLLFQIQPEPAEFTGATTD